MGRHGYRRTKKANIASGRGTPHHGFGTRGGTRIWGLHPSCKANVLDLADDTARKHQKVLVVIGRKNGFAALPKVYTGRERCDPVWLARAHGWCLGPSHPGLPSRVQMGAALPKDADVLALHNQGKHWLAAQISTGPATLARQGIYVTCRPCAWRLKQSD